MQILINNGNGYVDYTKYVSQESIQITDSINVPTLVQFTLCNLDSRFVVPRRSAYVRIITSNPNGRPLGPAGTTKTLATGFVTNEPVRKYLGLSQAPGPTYGFQLYTYDVKVTSDEWLLNVKSVPFIPAFVNQTQGQILAKLAQVLCPNFFDVCSHVASGDLVPYFQYDPEQTWSDIAKEFADSSRYRYKVIDRVVWYQPFGDAPLGISYDDTAPEYGFTPTGLAADVLTVPPVNDAIVVGDVEPQTYEEDNFIGDGFTGKFALKHPMFEGASDLLLQEDWSGDTFATDLWNVQDPGDNFNLAGALNVNGGLGLNTSYILGNNGVELGGGLNLQHGEFLFTDQNSGIVGGVYAPATGKDPNCATFDAPDLTLANCVAGFELGNASLYQVPVPVPSGQRVAWAMPTTVSGTGPTMCGTQSGDTPIVNLGQGVAEFWRSAPTCNTGPYILWGGFVMPTLPPGAVIQAIYPTCEARAWSADGLFLNVVHLNASNNLFGGPTLTGYPSVISATAPDYATAHSISVGTTPADVSSADMIAGFFQTLGILSTAPGTIIDIRNPRLAVYYTVGSGPDTNSVVVPSASGATGVTIQPIYNGVVQGPIVTTKLNHHYFLQTYINGRRYDRYTRTYRTLAGSAFGGDYQDSLAEITWVVNDIDLTREGSPITTTFYRLTGCVVPPFGLYAPINSEDLNLVLQTTLLAFPPQGTLEVRSLYGPTGGQLPVLPANLGPYQHYLLGFGFNNPVATIGVNNDINYLEFYSDAIFYSSGDLSLGTSTIPAVGARIKLKSWEAAQAVGRVRDPNNIAQESVIVGDDGVRLAILSNLSPLPRTSGECEQAAAAAISDRESTQFQGTYSCSSWFWDRTQDYPISGRYFECNSPQRGIFSRQLVATTVKITVDDMKGEWLSYDIDFSPDQYLEKLLVKFMQRSDNILTPKDAGKKVNFIYLSQLNESWLPDLQDATLLEYNGSQYTFDLGVNPAASGLVVEARRADANWGVSSKFLLATLTQQVNTFLRTQFDESIYLRLVDTTNLSVSGASGVLTSRFSKKIRIQAPLVPQAPVAGPIDLTIGQRPVFTFSLAQNQDIRNVYGLEVRDTSGNILAQQVFGSFQDLNWQFQNDSKLRAYTAYGYFFNLFWDYSTGCQMSYSVTMPSVSGLAIDESTHILSWRVLTGNPTGHRIEVERHPVDPNTPVGAVANTIYLASTVHCRVYQGDNTGICKATSGSTPLFTQDFQSLHFNTHPKSLLPGWTNADANQLHPLQNLGVTSGGSYSGASTPVSGNGYSAGSGSLATFDMIATGLLYVATAGVYYLGGAHDDGLIIGIGGGATGDAGNPSFNSPYSSTTPLMGYPIIYGNNRRIETDFANIKVTFPAAGYYPFEICYSEGPEDEHWSVVYGRNTKGGGSAFYDGSFWPDNGGTQGSVFTVLSTVGFTGVSGTNIYTINHPHNPTDIVTTQISDADFGVPSKITVIPFDQFGDGVPAYIYHNMSGNGAFAVSPAVLVTQPIPTPYEVAMSAGLVDLGTGKEIEYAARTFSVPDPGDVPQTYYVTVDDPDQVGDGSNITPSLTAYCDTDNSRYLSNPVRYFFAGKVIVTHTGGNTGSVAGPEGINQTLVVAA